MKCNRNYIKDFVRRNYICSALLAFTYTYTYVWTFRKNHLMQRVTPTWRFPATLFTFQSHNSWNRFLLSGSSTFHCTSFWVGCNLFERDLSYNFDRISLTSKLVWLFNYISCPVLEITPVVFKKFRIKLVPFYSVQSVENRTR